MPNYCNFQITVHGEPEDTERFAGYFSDSIEQAPGNERNEVYVPLDAGTFSDFDSDRDVSRLWLPKGNEIQRTKHGDMLIEGWCTWEVPTAWLEKVSNLMPSLTFSVKATIEHE